MARSKGKPALRSPGEGQQISRKEFLDVMADEGYSTGDRKTWFEDVPTHSHRAPISALTSRTDITLHGRRAEGNRRPNAAFTHWRIR